MFVSARKIQIRILNSRKDICFIFFIESDALDDKKMNLSTSSKNLTIDNSIIKEEPEEKYVRFDDLVLEEFNFFSRCLTFCSKQDKML